MSQIARNLTDVEEGILTGKRYLIHDRDPLFTAEFLSMIAGAGLESVKLPPRSLNAYAERCLRSIKESCLDHLILIGEASLHRATSNFLLHYHQERNHQSLGNRIIRPEVAEFPTAGVIDCRERLGGMLRYYYRKAA